MSPAPIDCPAPVSARIGLANRRLEGSNGRRLPARLTIRPHLAGIVASMTGSFVARGSAFDPASPERF